MNFIDLPERTIFEKIQGQAFQGTAVGIVTNNEDKEGLGRVKVKFPWLSEKDESTWARIASPMAGAGRGMYFLPEVDDEVLVLFEFGDINRPYIIGGLWNGKDLPPEKNEDGKNNLRVIKSRSGHKITLNDKDGEESIEITDKSGKNFIKINTKENAITIESAGDMSLLAPKGKFLIKADSIEMVSASGSVHKSDGDIAMEAGGDLNLVGTTVNLN